MLLIASTTVNDGPDVVVVVVLVVGEGPEEGFEAEVTVELVEGVDFSEPRDAEAAAGGERADGR